MTPVEKLKKMTGETDEGRLQMLYENAEQEILALTNRTKLNPALTAAAEKWALIAWNRMGLEGESSRYYAWYDFYHFPDRYNCWWGIRTLPCV